MRVLYILHNKTFDGSLISFFNMAEGLKERGIDVCIACSEDLCGLKQFRSRVDANDFTIFTVTIYASVLVKPHSLKTLYTRIKDLRWLLYYKYKSYRDVLTLARQLRPDIIHTNDSIIQEGYAVAKRLGIPHIWHIREYIDKGYDMWVYPCMWAFKRKLKKAKTISITNDILNHFELSGLSNANVIYNGIVSKNDCCLKYPKQKYFLCATRVYPEKKIDDVIKAFGKFSKLHTDYCLKIAGFYEYGYVRNLKKLVSEFCKEGSVEFLGFRNDVKLLMREATALIVASPFEGFGRMTAEASFYGCLTIGRMSGGTKEILEQTGGLMFNTIDELSRQMNVVDSMSEDEYVKLVSHAQKIAIEQFSIEQNVDKVYKLYHKVMLE